MIGSCDFNGDGTVTTSDLLKLLSQLGTVHVVPDTGHPPGHKPIVDMGAYEHQGK